MSTVCHRTIEEVYNLIDIRLNYTIDKILYLMINKSDQYVSKILGFFVK